MLIDTWNHFLKLVEERATPAEFHNWFVPIKPSMIDDEKLQLSVPNIFVQEYLLENYLNELKVAFGVSDRASLPIEFSISEKKQEKPKQKSLEKKKDDTVKLNDRYTFDNFIEGPSNQFVKSAALGVASKPGKSYNPLFIHGGVGLGKTHLLHSIGHYILSGKKRHRLHCITTEGFINDLVNHIKSRSVDKLKGFYRSLDILLVDDIQFLQNRLNFEEEFCNTFEALIHQGKQIVITCDKPPSSLKLSERLIARMEWGLVAQITPPDIETRVAILQHKAEQQGLVLPQKVAFFIAEHIYQNVRQLEGAINRLFAYCRMMHEEATEEVAEKTLSELFTPQRGKMVTIDSILGSVSSIFDVKVDDLKGKSRAKHIAFPRQVAMYLAKEMLGGSLMQLAASFGGKTHSTLIHAWKKVSRQVETDKGLQQQIHHAKETMGVQN